MSNTITQKYFDHIDFSEQASRALREISAATHFTPEKELFRGKIYDDNKVGSVLVKGMWNGAPAVLKIQGLKPEIDEIEMIRRFMEQNESKRIRLPKLYTGSLWNERDGYGFLLLEYIDAPRMYTQPFAEPQEMEEFCSLYQEYKTHCLRTPLFQKDVNEQSSLVFTAQRISHWVQIALAKGTLTEKDVNCTERFLTLAGKHFPSIPMEFMHGHLSSDDIFKVSADEYMLMSNLFWSYRPKWYDTTFHLWAGIKKMRDRSRDTDQVIAYIRTWLEAYKQLPVVNTDPDFERVFYLQLSERCIGSLLIDVNNQHYTADREERVAYLRTVFERLFNYCEEQL